MADFLTRLASRTLGLAAMAEPVIVPMFAPEPSLPAMAGSDENFDASHAPEPMFTPGVVRPASSLESMVRPIAPRPGHDLIEARLTQPSARETTRRTAMTAPDDAIVGDAPAPRRSPLTSVASRAADEEALLMPSADALRRPSLVGTSKPAETPLSAQTDSPNPTRTPSMWPEEPVAASDGSVVRQGRAAPSSWDVEPDEPLLLPLSPVEAMSMRPDVRAAVTPADEPEQPRRAEREQAAASATPPPTIEITIGRVEVRAVHPPAPVAGRRRSLRPRRACRSKNICETRTGEGDEQFPGDRHRYRHPAPDPG